MYIYTLSDLFQYYHCILSDLCLITLNCYFIALFFLWLKFHGYFPQVFFQMNNVVKFHLFTYTILSNSVLNMSCKEQRAWFYFYNLYKSQCPLIRDYFGNFYSVWLLSFYRTLPDFLCFFILSFDNLIIFSLLAFYRGLEVIYLILTVIA